MQYRNRSNKHAEGDAPGQAVIAAPMLSMIEEATRSHRQAVQRLAELEQVLREARQRREAALGSVTEARRRRDCATELKKRMLGLYQQVCQVALAACGGHVTNTERARHLLQVERAALQARRVQLDQAVLYRGRLLKLLEATRRLDPVQIPSGERAETARAMHAKALTAKQAGETLLRCSRTLVASLRGMLAQVQGVIVPLQPRPAQTIDLQVIRNRRDEEHRHLQLQQREAESLAGQAAVLRHVVAGATEMGLGSYLARARPEAKDMVHEVYREACDAGKARAGRRAQPAVDAQAEERRRRKADRERERRKAAKQTLAVLSPEERDRIEAERKAKHRADRSARRQVEMRVPDPVLDGSRPRHRQHEERIKKAEPGKQALLTARLLTARERGHAAAVRDAAARSSQTVGIWRNQHPSRSLPDGCKLIAVRGARSDPTDAMSAILEPGGLERWLREPAVERAKRMKGRARLVHVAGHLTAAWSDILKEMARTGTSLEEAAAFRVDEAIARFDLTGHRVAAYWHTDSTTGHPHLHIVWARVRDEDLSLWSLESRARASALWLHARSNTVMAAGAAALQDDVDALGGFSDAAVDAEVMLAHDDIVAHRRLIDGTNLKITLQGDEAVGRVARLGSGPFLLAGGMWLFGLGPDPEQVRARNSALAAAKRSGDVQQYQALLADRPKNRGYWLPLRGDSAGLDDVLASDHFGDYLSRRRT
jgi:hypothetical protein